MQKIKTTYEKNENNKIKNSALCCIYCGKSYKTRLNLEKHLILCEITHKSNKPHHNDCDMDDSLDDYISSKKLYQIVIKLSLKCNRLEDRVAELSKYVTKKIKKIDIIEYLNNKSNSNPSSTTLLFENITEIIKVEQSDVEFLFYNSFLETVNLVLSRSIYKDNESHDLPIAAFKEKKNTLYVYSKNNNINNNQNPTWSIVTRENFIRFLNIIQFKISKAFSEWRKNNSQILNDDDNRSILYDKTFSKLMEPDFKIEKTFVKFYNNIYKGTLVSI